MFLAILLVADTIIGACVVIGVVGSVGFITLGTLCTLKEVMPFGQTPIFLLNETEVTSPAAASVTALTVSGSKTPSSYNPIATTPAVADEIVPLQFISRYIYKII